jgi:hypothetical protein
VHPISPAQDITVGSAVSAYRTGFTVKSTSSPDTAVVVAWYLVEQS